MAHELINFLKGKEIAYRHALGNKMGDVVLSDLRTFCNATKTSFSTDALEMARNEGRREVFNRIMTFMKIDAADLYNYNEEYPE